MDGIQGVARKVTRRGGGTDSPSNLALQGEAELGKCSAEEHKRNIGNVHRSNASQAKLNVKLGQIGKRCPKRASGQVERLGQSQLRIREYGK